MSGWAFNTDDRDRGNYRLALSLLLAGALHAAVILGVETPSRERAHQGAVLEFTLTALPAQGDADASGHGHSPAPVSGGTDAGTSPESAGAPAAAPPAPATDSPQPFQRPAGLRGLPYRELVKEIASSEARREAERALSGHSRIRRLGSSSTMNVAEAAYLDMWVEKVERIGRSNYPAGGVSGELLLLAVVRYDGALEEVRILESSGPPAVDEAALRIVRLAAPYTHFPTELRKSYDRLEIVRSWRFARTDAP